MIRRTTTLFLLLAAISFSQTDPLIIAHRGASSVAPENTLVAFTKAVELGANILEIDVRQTKDSQLVIIHDGTVDRTTNGKGKISGFTMQEVKKLDAGSWFSRQYQNERIPTLAELFAIADSSVMIIIEIKDEEEVSPGITERVLSLIKQYGKEEHVMLKSFYPDAIQKFKRLAPDIPRVYVFAFHIPWLNFTFGTVPRFENVFEIPATYLQVHRRALTESFIRASHKKGFKVIVWGVKKEDDMLEFVDAGVDGIETDNPKLLRTILMEK